MKLIIGLGNPGKKYQKTWHNLGFLTLEKLQENLGLPKFKPAKKFESEISTGRLGREKIILAKPLTFMNNSGRAVEKLKKYHRLKPKEIIIIRDDLDLPLGKIRIAKNSSAGGHNGIKSIINYLKSQNFVQIKIGVKTPKTENQPAEHYLLENRRLSQKPKINQVIKTAAEATEETAGNSPETAMNRWN